MPTKRLHENSYSYLSPGDLLQALCRDVSVREMLGFAGRDSRGERVRDGNLAPAGAGNGCEMGISHQQRHSFTILDVINRLTLTCLAILLPTGACGPAHSHEKRAIETTRSQPQTLSSALQETPDPPAPMISVVVAQGANPFDNPGGVTFAVWSDGRVMRSAFPERVTNWITQGRLSSAQLDEIRQATMMLRDHEEPKGHFCCSHMSVKVAEGANKGTYTHQLATGRKSKPISDFVEFLWTLDIADAVRVSGVEHGRFPNSGLKDIYPTG
ncbi:MAG: hypothetical protein H6819_10075 [Phycisphaerales bacterium]|nr:hypothetical protein [Phycisphaerales bacterium]MCB9857996.1 hypothetical protein [Phycisphaerales bacterium]